MALTFAHVSCGFVGARGRDNVVQSVVSDVRNSQTLTAAGTTSFVAPAPGFGATIGDPCYEVSAATGVDLYAAVGKPGVVDASQATGAGATARTFIRGGDTRNIFCQPGDACALIAA